MDFKELKALLKLCRKEGVTEIAMGEVSFKLGPLPDKLHIETQSSPDDVQDRWANFPSGDLSPEQAMYYASGGTPELDPFRNDT